MDPVQNILNSLCAYAIKDSVRSSAYEAVNPEQRGAIKQSIARLYNFWGKGAASGESTSRYDSFVAHQQCEPAQYTLVYCRGTGLPGLHLVPALLPAVMAGVAHIVPWFILDDGASPGGDGACLGDDVFFALELMGLQYAFCSSGAEAAGATTPILDACTGRCVFLPFLPECDSLILSVARRGIPMQVCFPDGQIYPELSPQWFINKRITFEP